MNPTHTIVENNAVSYTLDDRTVNMNGDNKAGTININANLSVKCVSITSNLSGLSSGLTPLRNTRGNNVSIPIQQSSALNIYLNNAEVYGLTVFNLVGKRVLNDQLVQQIAIIMGSNVTCTLQLIVINLSGTSISFAQGNLVGIWLNSISTGRAHTLWNLSQATSLFITHNWMGALFAPYPVVTASVNIDGATAVLSLTTTAELHDPPIILPPCITSTGAAVQVASSQTPVSTAIQMTQNENMMLLLFSCLLIMILEYF